jgi:ankyrin repeat protein
VASVRSYLGAGGDPNALDSKNRTTPLQYASGYNKLPVVVELLAAGADPAVAVDPRGMCALARAAARGHTAVVQALLQDTGVNPRQRCAQAGQTPLMYASQFGHVEVAGALLQHFRANGSTQAAVEELDGSGCSSLHLAAKWGKVELVTVLLTDNGADVNLRASDILGGITPAQLAAQWGHVAVLRVLHAHGADFGIRCGSVSGRTVLEGALEWQRAACVDYLMSV